MSRGRRLTSKRHSVTAAFLVVISLGVVSSVIDEVVLAFLRPQAVQDSPGGKEIAHMSTTPSQALPGMHSKARTKVDPPSLSGTTVSLESRPALRRELAIALPSVLLQTWTTPLVANALYNEEYSPMDVPESVSFWEPLASLIIICGGAFALRLKTDRAVAARDERGDKEEQIRKFEMAKLTGKDSILMTNLDGEGNSISRKFEMANLDLETLLDELEQLVKIEQQEKEVFGFGEASPTSLRTSLDITINKRAQDLLESPLLRLRRRGKEGSDGSEPYVPESWTDDRLQTIIMLAIIPILGSFLLWISGT